MQTQTQMELLNRFQKHLENGTTDSAEYALRVPAAHYIDDQQTQKEVDEMFRRSPLLVALSPDLPKKGSYMTHQAHDTDLLLTRGMDGKVRAFVNACMHRGARLADGRGITKLFSCPFHAWTWQLDGALKARPNSCGGFDDVPPHCDQLIEKPSLELGGMIFVLLEGDDIVKKVKDMLGAALPELANYNIADTVFMGAKTCERPCNYKMIIDAFAESYHLGPLHKNSVSPYIYSDPALTDAFGNVVRNIGVHRSVVKEFDKAPKARAFLPHGTTQYIIAPNVLLTYQVDHMELWRTYPVGGASTCRTELSIYWPAPITEEAKRKCKKNLELIWKVTTTEDIPVALQIFNNLKSGDLPEIIYGKNEPGLIYYHSAIARKIGSNKLIPANV